jgi:hypothetical protein
MQLDLAAPTVRAGAQSVSASALLWVVKGEARYMPASGGTRARRCTWASSTEDTTETEPPRPHGRSSDDSANFLFNRNRFARASAGDHPHTAATARNGCPRCHCRDMGCRSASCCAREEVIAVQAALDLPLPRPQAAIHESRRRIRIEDGGPVTTGLDTIARRSIEYLDQLEPHSAKTIYDIGKVNTQPGRPNPTQARPGRYRYQDMGGSRALAATGLAALVDDLDDQHEETLVADIAL